MGTGFRSCAISRQDRNPVATGECFLVDSQSRSSKKQVLEFKLGSGCRDMIRRSLFAGVVLAICLPSAAHALATEQLGNKPITGWGFEGSLLKIVNVHARVYWFEVNGNPFFFFKGGPKELNEGLQAFADLKADKKEIILMAGLGGTKTFDGKPVAFDWSVHVPMGLRLDGDSEVADTRATFTIYIPNPLPAGKVDADKVRQWIADLNSDDFKVRDKASAELEALGSPVAAGLREALKTAPAAEARERLERVLDRVSGAIRLDVLKIPEGIPVIGVESLLERARKELSNKDSYVRGRAATSLRPRGVGAAEIVPDLEKVLKEEKHEYPLRCAMSIACHVGTAGKPLLPALRDLLKSDDKNVVNFAQYAIDAIEKAKDEPVDEAETKKRATIRTEIQEFVKGREKKER